MASARDYTPMSHRAHERTDSEALALDSVRV